MRDDFSYCQHAVDSVAAPVQSLSRNSQAVTRGYRKDAGLNSVTSGLCFAILQFCDIPVLCFAILVCSLLSSPLPVCILCCYRRQHRCIMKPEDALCSAAIPFLPIQSHMHCAVARMICAHGISVWISATLRGFDALGFPSHDGTGIASAAAPSQQAEPPATMPPSACGARSPPTEEVCAALVPARQRLPSARGRCIPGRPLARPACARS